MAKYSVTMQRTLSAAASVGGVTVGATARRLKLYDLTIGSEAVPANFANLWELQRFTAPGTASAVVPQALDLADGAALFTAEQLCTVEPTYTAAAILLAVSLNQQATYRWVSIQGGELVVPATTDAGIGVKTPTVGFAAAATFSTHVEEQ